MRILSKIEQRWTIRLLLRGSGRNITSIGTRSSKVPIMFSHVIELKLLLHPLLIVNTSTARCLTAPEVNWQVVSHIYNLCHIFHVVTKALTRGTHHVDLIAIARPEVSNVVCKALSLRCLALAFQGLQVQIILLIST